MREIKFRAWDKERNTMLDVIELNLFSGNVTLPADSERYGRSLSAVELMQFAGLHDKNGKEIWEGDVLGFYVNAGKGKVPLGEVYFDEHRRAWMLKNGKRYLDHSEWPSSPEVIGNIYENPELLEANAPRS
jgi:uncharacterized phage protein (TIGR01671 family)